MDINRVVACDVAMEWGMPDSLRGQSDLVHGRSSPDVESVHDMLDEDLLTSLVLLSIEVRLDRYIFGGFLV